MQRSAAPSLSIRYHQKPAPQPARPLVRPPAKNTKFRAFKLSDALTYTQRTTAHLCSPPPNPSKPPRPSETHLLPLAKNSKPQASNSVEKTPLQNPRPTTPHLPYKREITTYAAHASSRNAANDTAHQVLRPRSYQSWFQLWRYPTSCIAFPECLRSPLS